MFILQQAALGDEVGGLTSNDQSRFVGVKTSSQGCSGATPRLLRPSSHPAPPCPPPAGVGVNSGIHPPHAEVGRLAEVSPFLSRERSSEGRPAAATTTRHGVGGAYSMVVFALSPSGRALMLTVPQAATVLDAKAQLAVGWVLSAHGSTRAALLDTRGEYKRIGQYLCRSENARAGQTRSRMIKVSSNKGDQTSRLPKQYRQLSTFYHPHAR